ncbi:hypothetical protein FRC11_000166, partial [Ceratobasidium sp. 423]
TLLQQQAGLEVGHSDTMLTELAKHFAPGSHYGNCTITDLKRLACNVYQNYMTTESFHKTLKRAEPELFTSTNSIQKAIFDKFECYKQDPNYVRGFSKSS